ncbi:MAG TPA: LamG-like jellyroll fold domain-containing protein [Gemmataceae bacterium]
MRTLSLIAILVLTPVAAADFRAGAVAVDITPSTFPVLVNGMFEERTATKAVDPLHARALALADGTTRIALVIVDSCMMPRELLNKAKALAQQTTGIPTDHILIAATHTHSAPAAMGCLGTRVDPAYPEFLVPQLVRSIELANKNLAPAQIGWAVVRDPEHTANRRWIRRPDRVLIDPFGKPTVRANMHPGYLSPDVTGASGPVDAGLSVLAVRSPTGKPIAVLANFSMHYFSSPSLSADYFGRFADKIGKLVGNSGDGTQFVGILSQGTSGDLYRVDYSRPQRPDTIEAYSAAIADKAFEAYTSIQWHDSVPLAMREATLKLRRRVPDAERLASAKKTAAQVKGPVPKTREQIYAFEQIYLDKEPERELKLQALRIGGLGIAAIPDEVFALTGLKIKAQSPLEPTFTIELANGAEGYIPPPEQHALGGYTTWAARTAALEVQAEPRIVETVLKLLEEVAGKPRRPIREPLDGYAKAVLASKPTAYWRLDEMSGDAAHDATGHEHVATFEGGHALYLDGSTAGNHAVHFAGGRMTTPLDVAEKDTVEMWFWNGLLTDVRPVTGHLLECGPDRVSVGGTGGPTGRLVFGHGTWDQVAAGKTDVGRYQWHHLAVIRDGPSVTMYLDGKIEIHGQLSSSEPRRELILAGRGDGAASWEGKLDEVAVYDRALSADEIASHFRAASR